MDEIKKKRELKAERKSKQEDNVKRKQEEKEAKQSTRVRFAQEEKPVDKKEEELGDAEFNESKDKRAQRGGGMIGKRPMRR